jgi:hypothetical protein
MATGQTADDNNGAGPEPVRTARIARFGSQLNAILQSILLLPPFDDGARLPHDTGTIGTLEFVPTSGPNQSRACSFYGFGVARPQANGFDHAQPCHALGTEAVTRHRKFGARTHKSAFCKRGSVNVRFAPKATQVLHCRELTRCAKLHTTKGSAAADRVSPSSRPVAGSRSMTVLLPTKFELVINLSKPGRCGSPCRRRCSPAPTR